VYDLVYKIATEKVTIMNETELGEGDFGQVFKGKYDGIKIVAKQLKDKSNLAEFFKESSLNYKLNHSSVIDCYGYSEIGKEIYLICKYAIGGALDF